MRANFSYETGVFIGGSKDISIAERLEQIKLWSFYRGEFSDYDSMLLVPAIYDTIRKVRELSKDSVREYLWNILWPILQKKIEDKIEIISQCTKERWEDRNEPWLDGYKEDIEKRLADMTETKCLEIFNKEFNYCWKSKYTRDRKQKPERLCYIALKEHNFIHYAIYKLLNEKVCQWLVVLLFFVPPIYLHLHGRNESFMWWDGIFLFSYLVMGYDNNEEQYLRRYRCTLGASLLCFVVGGIKTFHYGEFATGEDLFYLGVINLVLVLHTYIDKAATKLGFRIGR